MGYSLSMKVNIDVFKKWIEENGPDGVAKLAIGSGISSSTIRKIRSGYVPKKVSTRREIARFMRLPEDQIFPESKGKSRAS